MIKNRGRILIIEKMKRETKMNERRKKREGERERDVAKR